MYIVQTAVFERSKADFVKLTSKLLAGRRVLTSPAGQNLLFSKRPTGGAVFNNC